MNQIVNQLNKISERYLLNDNQDELRLDLENLITQLNAEELKSSSPPMGIATLVNEREAYFFDASIAKTKEFIPSGFKLLDDELGGWRKSELVVIGARPGMGKTQLMIEMIVRLIEQNIKCGLISIDQNKIAMLNRLVCNMTELELAAIVKGEFYGRDKEQVKKTLEKLKQLPLWISDNYSGTVSLLIERCKQLVEENKVEFIFIDYLQLIGSIHRRFNREAELASITRALKRIALENNITIVVLSQLSRNVEMRASGSKRPMLSDLRESGAIEQDADKVMFLYRPEYYGLTEDENGLSTKRRAELIVAKNKIGTEIDIPLIVTKKFTGFKDLSEVENEIDINENRLNELK